MVMYIRHMQVRSANAAAFHRDDEIIIARDWVRDVGDRERSFGALKDGSSHRVILEL